MCVCALPNRNLELNNWYNYELPLPSVTSRRFLTPVQRVRLSKYWRDLLVEYPRFSKRLLDSEVKPGHNVYLEVKAHGSPDLRVKWYKNGQPLVETSNVYVRIWRRRCVQVHKINPICIRIGNALPAGLVRADHSRCTGQRPRPLFVHCQQHGGRVADDGPCGRGSAKGSGYLSQRSVLRAIVRPLMKDTAILVCLCDVM